MAAVEDSIRVDVSPAAAYDLWTRFEEFPRFMRDIDHVYRLDEDHLLWQAHMGGFKQAWEVQVTERSPEEGRVAWASTSGPLERTTVTVEPAGDGRSRVSVAMEFEWEGFMDTSAELVAFMRRRVGQSMEAFKEFAESEAAPEEGGEEEAEIVAVEDSIDAGVPLATAYDLWTRFEEFPRFMEGVEEVRRLDRDRLLWRVDVRDYVAQWEARITEMDPEGGRIAWRSTGGAYRGGSVWLDALDRDRTRVTLGTEFQFATFVESKAEEIEFVRHLIRRDLQMFKDLAESGEASGGQ